MLPSTTYVILFKYYHYLEFAHLELYQDKVALTINIQSFNKIKHQI